MMPVSERNQRPRMTYDTAVSIRQRRAAGERGIDLAAEFGVSVQVICDIVHRRRWAHPDAEHYQREMYGWRSRALDAERRVEQLLYELAEARTHITRQEVTIGRLLGAVDSTPLHPVVRSEVERLKQDTDHA